MLRIKGESYDLETGDKITITEEDYIRIQSSDSKQQHLINPADGKEVKEEEQNKKIDTYPSKMSPSLLQQIFGDKQFTENGISIIIPDTTKSIAGVLNIEENKGYFTVDIPELKEEKVHVHFENKSLVGIGGYDLTPPIRFLDESGKVPDNLAQTLKDALVKTNESDQKKFVSLLTEKVQWPEGTKVSAGESHLDMNGTKDFLLDGIKVLVSNSGIWSIGGKEIKPSIDVFESEIKKTEDKGWKIGEEIVETVQRLKKESKIVLKNTSGALVNIQTRTQTGTKDRALIDIAVNKDNEITMNGYKGDIEAQPFELGKGGSLEVEINKKEKNVPMPEKEKSKTERDIFVEGLQKITFSNGFELVEPTLHSNTFFDYFDGTGGFRIKHPGGKSLVGFNLKNGQIISVDGKKVAPINFFETSSKEIIPGVEKKIEKLLQTEIK